MSAMPTVEEALSLLLANTPDSTRQETASIPFGATGRVLARTISARIDSPPFNRSPLDGYAVNHRDLIGATPRTPARLRVTATLFAGDPALCALGPGEAARVMTGAELPKGATCVAWQEDSERHGDIVAIRAAADEFENYIFQGEDIRAGETLLRRGLSLDPGAIGLLAGQGIGEVPVFARPRLAVLSTGSELVPLGQSGNHPLEPGKIYDSNLHALSAQALAAGAEIPVAAAEKDDPAALAATMARLLEQCDFLVTSGGVSVGDRDYLAEAGERLGAERLFHGVAVKPGSPALGLVQGGKPILCLSGNPFAAFVTFSLLAVPVLRKLGGCERVLPVRVEAVLSGKFGKSGSTRRMLPARLAGGTVFPGDGGASGRSPVSLVGCDCLIDIPAGSGPLQNGDRVEVILP